MDQPGGNGRVGVRGYCVHVFIIPPAAHCDERLLLTVNSEIKLRQLAMAIYSGFSQMRFSLVTV